MLQIIVSSSFSFIHSSDMFVVAIAFSANYSHYLQYVVTLRKIGFNSNIVSFLWHAA